MRVSPARKIAFDILHRVESQDAFATDLLYARLEKGMKREDAALATELVMGVLRWRRQLDFLIERAAHRSASSLDLEVLLALRLGIYQMRFLTRVPRAAAVNESVELVKSARKRSAAPFVNAVLRRTPRAAIEKLLPADLPAAELLALKFSFPDWLVKRWIARFGEKPTALFLEIQNRPPRVMVSVPALGRLVPVREALEAEGLTVEPGQMLRSGFHIRGGNPAQTQAFARGWFTIQDEASQMIPLLLDVRPGQRVLDLCAAPGGKTARLALASGKPENIVAADLHTHRLRGLRSFLARLDLAELPLVALDATLPLPFATTFDRILVDAPCSGTGTLGRNPEIRWRLRPEDLPELQTKQIAILSRALDVLAPDGKLVYSTCSLEPEENQEVVAAALAGRPEFRRISGAAALAPHLLPDSEPARLLFDEEGDFRTLPWVHSTDGFYAAVLEKLA
jgi:16S rRNA (cytosine967-C5)-methyltransferase